MNVIENIVTTNWPYRADFEHKVLKPGALRRDLWGFKQSQIGAFDLLRPWSCLTKSKTNIKWPL